MGIVIGTRYHVYPLVASGTTKSPPPSSRRFEIVFRLLGSGTRRLKVWTPVLKA